MKESVRNFIKIMILFVVGIVVGGTWGFFCPRIFPNIPLATIASILGSFAIGYGLGKVFIRLNNKKEK